MRTQPPLHLTKSPLIFVLAQVRFAPILKMAEYVPEIQEALRRKGFPGYQVRATQEISFLPVLQAAQSERWFFSSRDRVRSVILAPDFVVLATSEYDRFESFAAELEQTLAIVKTASSPEFSSRIGLRYVDLIRPGPGESLDDYLQAGIRGLRPEEIGATSTLHQLQIQAKTPAGSLSVRLWQNTDGRVLPPDIAGDEVAFRVDSAPQGELLTILDLDHSSEVQREFEPPTLLADLWDLHAGTDRAFRAIVTLGARVRWGDESLSTP